MKKIAVEEHISMREYENYLDRFFPSPEKPPESIENPSEDPGDFEGLHLRLKTMDEVGIDMQVLSMRNPGVELFETDDAVFWARKINDSLAGLTEKYPDRFAAFCMIPWQEPALAVRELERSVRELGLVGIKTQSHINGDYLDNKKYWPVFEKAQELDVPIFIHPSEPSPDMLKPYLAYPGLSGAMLGFSAEVSLHAMRLILSGLFDTFPNLKIILGHMGEGLPYWLPRMSKYGPGGQSTLKKEPRDYVKNNFFASTSGMFYYPALMCAYLALGADNILFAVDYPTESDAEAVRFIDLAPICDSDREKICHLNAEKLFKL